MAGDSAEFRHMKVPELKCFLSDRGIKTSGKRKDELIELSLKARDTYEVLEASDHDKSVYNRRRILKNDVTIINVNGCHVNWSSNLQNMPTKGLGDVFAYLLTNCQWTPERLRNFRKDDGYLLHKDRHVENVEMGHITGHCDVVYIRGNIKPEQRDS